MIQRFISSAGNGVAFGAAALTFAYPVKLLWNYNFVNHQISFFGGFIIAAIVIYVLDALDP